MQISTHANSASNARTTHSFQCSNTVCPMFGHTAHKHWTLWCSRVCIFSNKCSCCLYLCVYVCMCVIDSFVFVSWAQRPGCTWRGPGAQEIEKTKVHTCAGPWRARLGEFPAWSTFKVAWFTFKIACSFFRHWSARTVPGKKSKFEILSGTVQGDWNQLKSMTINWNHSKLCVSMQSSEILTRFTVKVTWSTFNVAWFTFNRAILAWFTVKVAWFTFQVAWFTPNAAHLSNPCQTLSNPCQTLVKALSNPRHTIVKPLSNPCQTLVKPLSNLVNLCQTLVKPCQTLVKPLSNLRQTLVKPSSNHCQTIVKPLSNPCQTLSNPCQTIVKPLSNPFKPLSNPRQTIVKPLSVHCRFKKSTALSCVQTSAMIALSLLAMPKAMGRKESMICLILIWFHLDFFIFEESTLPRGGENSNKVRLHLWIRLWYSN